MGKTLLVCGYGPGISDAVARRFGAEGFQVALVARNAERLTAGQRALAALGVKVATFTTDLGDPGAAKAVVASAREKFGPITAVHWNAYSGAAGDLLRADPAPIRTAIDIAVTSLLATVQEAHADLKAERGAVLVTNGGFGLADPKVDAMAVQFGAMGLAVANAAKHKLVGLLAERLRGDGIYVGEVMVLNTVKGTAFDSGSATLEASTVADKFWQLYSRRDVLSVKAS